jgi:predicted secreted hydrolase
MRTGGLAAVLAVVLAVVLACVFLASCTRREAVDPAAPPLAEALAGLDALARQFPEPGDAPLDWPRDHGAKPGQFAESWLFAGLVQDEDGNDYGFQLAFDRVAVEPDAPGRSSAWATRDIYRARFSLEPAGGRARGEERLSRAALGLAGAAEQPARAWLEDWHFTAEEDGRTFLLEGSRGTDRFSLRLFLPAGEPVAIDDDLYRGYWWPGLRVQGAVQIEGQSRAVTGRGMLDRLWGRGLPAGRGQLALARLWLEGEEGWAIRCAQLRRRTGDGTPLTECLGHPARPGDLRLEPVEGEWQIVAGRRVPLHWRLARAEGSAAHGPAVIAPLSAERPASPDGRWSGIVVGAGEGIRWGLLELSNFAAP